MSTKDIATIVIVFVVALGGLAGVASLLERRRKASGAVGPQLPPLGPAGRRLLWIIRGLVAVMILSLLIALVWGSVWAIWTAAGCIVIYIVVRSIFQFTRLSGK